ncbi:NAD(P)-dependent oxidoreductase [Arthrobacter sp. W4I7]|uniref:SDR family oxidoreductase n=1 Tax=Arthrobacter sp. W4I7 TaxID=3042296 RepID=UPI002789DE1D|nr:NAD(P)-dependent oxidoreductase [Arthrobacter sp. W4I7]MDQ0691352.1 citronellol/citronellal dehydrogenase [Arthrobacter sp. W4I7]
MTTATGALGGKTIIMSGGSRGIGLAIALKAAADGANIVLLAKTAAATTKLSGTIFEAAEKIEQAGGRSLAVVGDVRSDDSIAEAVEAALSTFGSIDICINNASALHPHGTLALTPSQYDLMQDVNTRGTFMLTRACLPHLLAAENPHVLTLSPPLNLTSQQWLARFPGYLLSKYGMSLVTLSIAAEFRDQGIAVNSLWPRTTIATDAVGNLLGGAEALLRARRPDIMADAAYAILTTASGKRTGHLLIDDEVLRENGVTEFSRYAVSGIDDNLDTDFFLD